MKLDNGELDGKTPSGDTISSDGTRLIVESLAEQAIYERCKNILDESVRSPSPAGETTFSRIVNPMVYEEGSYFQRLISDPDEALRELAESSRDENVKESLNKLVSEVRSHKQIDPESRYYYFVIQAVLELKARSLAVPQNRERLSDIANSTLVEGLQVKLLNCATKLLMETQEGKTLAATISDEVFQEYAKPYDIRRSAERVLGLTD